MIITQKDTWFFLNETTGQIIAAESREAWELLYAPKTEWQNVNIKLIGYSNLESMSKYISEYKQSIIDAKKFNDSLIEKRKAIKEKEEYMLKGEKHTAEDLKVIATKMKDIESLESNLKDIYKVAFDKEVEIAKENIKSGQYILPTHTNIFTPGADDNTRSKILNIMPAK